jgi:hypothetical protein
MNPSKETQQKIAEYIYSQGRIPSLGAYSWTLGQLERLAHAANAYRQEHDGMEAEGSQDLYRMIDELRGPNPKRPRPLARTGWKAVSGEVRVTGIDINRRRH